VRARWSAFGLAKAVEVAVAFAPFATQLSWPVAAIIVCLADNLDGILVHGLDGRRYWGRYRGAERWADFATFMPLAAYPLWAGILKEIWPVLILLIILVPLITVGKIALEGWKRVFRPGTFEVLLPVAMATLAGLDPGLPAVFGLAASPLVQVWVHGFRWKLPAGQTALAGFLASSLWLAVGWLLTGAWHPGLVAVPLLAFFAAFERG